MLFKLRRQLLLAVIIPNTVFALPFAISPTPGSTLPTQLTPEQSTTALYTVTNNTASIRSNNSVYYLPPNVSQITSNTSYPDLCGSSFTLQPKNTAGDSCILQLLISGAVNGSDSNPKNHLFVCFPGGKTCAGTPSPLNVITTPILPVVAAAGSYLNAEGNTPIEIQTTLDNGITWSQQNVPLITGYVQGTLNGMSCSNGGCVGAGYYEDQNTDEFSAIAASTDNGTTWSQQILTAPANFSQGRLSGIYCNSTTCQAVGSYQNQSGNTLPSVATTNNAGATWSQQIIDLPTDYNIGEMNGITCTSNTCIGVGYFRTSAAPNLETPGVITSTNGGTSWSTQVLPLPQPTTDTGQLTGVSCSGSACVAAGFYNNSTAIVFVSTNQGSTWTQQPDFTFTPYDYTKFNGINCTATYCVAIGFAITGTNPSDNPHHPIIAISDAAGTTWSQQILPVISGYSHGCELNGVQCTNNVCIAAGDCAGDTTVSPLIAVSTNNGATWSEQILALPAGGLAGAFLGIG